MNAKLKELIDEVKAEPATTGTTAKELLAEAMTVMPPEDPKDPVSSLMRSIVAAVTTMAKEAIPNLTPLEVLVCAADGCARMGRATAVAKDPKDPMTIALRQSLARYCDAYLAALREIGS